MLNFTGSGFGMTHLYVPSGEQPLDLFDVNGFEISIHQCSTHYTHVRNGGVLDMEVHQNVHILDHELWNYLTLLKNLKFENGFKSCLWLNNM